MKKISLKTFKKFGIVLLVGLFASLLMIVSTANKSYADEYVAADVTVTYDANGADSGQCPNKQEACYNEDIRVASNYGDLKKEGYKFIGWNTEANATGTHYNVDDVYSENLNITLYAEWEENFASINGTIIFPEVTGVGTCIVDLIDENNKIIATADPYIDAPEFSFNKVIKGHAYKLKMHDEQGYGYVASSDIPCLQDSVTLDPIAIRRVIVHVFGELKYKPLISDTTPLSNATLEMLDSNNNVIETQQTGSLGTYGFDVNNVEHPVIKFRVNHITASYKITLLSDEIHLGQSDFEYCALCQCEDIG